MFTYSKNLERPRTQTSASQNTRGGRNYFILQPGTQLFHLSQDPSKLIYSGFQTGRSRFSGASFFTLVPLCVDYEIPLRSNTVVTNAHPLVILDDTEASTPLCEDGTWHREEQYTGECLQWADGCAQYLEDAYTAVHVNHESKNVTFTPEIILFERAINKLGQVALL